MAKAYNMRLLQTFTYRGIGRRKTSKALQRILDKHRFQGWAFSLINASPSGPLQLNTCDLLGIRAWSVLRAYTLPISKSIQRVCCRHVYIRIKVYVCL